MTVTKIGSVNTPRVVTVAVDYEDVVRGLGREVTSEVARMRSSRAKSVSECRGRIHGGDFAVVSRKRMSFAVFLSSSSIGCIVHDCHARRRCEETSRNNHPVDASRRMSDAF